jgi:transcriptional regulator with XRE-family HTH domain
MRSIERRSAEISDKDAEAISIAGQKLASTMKLLRELKQVSMRDHAKQLGMSPATLCRIEAGDLPDLVNLIKIRVRTGISYATLLGEEKPAATTE